MSAGSLVAATDWTGIAMKLDPSNQILSTWDSNSDACANPPFKVRVSKGVKCNANKEVIEISLRSLGLSGEVPPEIVQLNKLTWLDLGENSLHGNIPVDIANLPSLMVLNLCCNNIGGVIPDLGRMSNLLAIDLSNNILSDTIPASLGNLPQLKFLELNNNQLSGEIPASIGNLKRLKSISLAHNQLQGRVPKGLNYLRDSPAKYNFSENGYGWHTIGLTIGDRGNNGLSYSYATTKLPLTAIRSDKDLNPPSASKRGYGSSKSKGKARSPTGAEAAGGDAGGGSGAAAAAGAAAGAATGAAIAGSGRSSSKKKSPSKRHSPSKHHRIDIESGNNGASGYHSGYHTVDVPPVTVVELPPEPAVRSVREPEAAVSAVSATGAAAGAAIAGAGSKSKGRQSQRNVLGTGRDGSVYKARLPDGTTVAVKRLTQRNLDQSAREFRFEVESLAHARHPNLVALLGCCAEEDERMLVYEFVPNGSLDAWLHQNSNMEPIDWPMRMHIAIGCARGLSHLHEGLDMKVVHRDVKASNVLLDAQWNPKLGDFAIAKVMGRDQSHTATRVVGTFGYVAPEYMNTGLLTERSDVYSFGVLLLEIISGRKPIDNGAPPDEMDLVTWAKKLSSQERLVEIVDPRLQGMISPDDAEYVLGIAMRCVETNALKRPRMTQIVHMLESEDPKQRDDWVARRPSPVSARSLTIRDPSPSYANGNMTAPGRSESSRASPRPLYSNGRTDSLRSLSPRCSLAASSPGAPDVGALIANAAMRSSPRALSPPPLRPSPGAPKGASPRFMSPRAASPRSASPNADAANIIASHAMSINAQRRPGSWSRR
ncbi:unnamed protein product [Closterium sp. NIES-53]